MTPTFMPSPEQSAFFEALTQTSANLQLQAAAGSGKTTTIVQAVKLLPPGLLVKFLAFNKAIADELSVRLPQSCQVKTFHAEGYAAYGRHLGKRPKLDGDKTYSLLKNILREWAELSVYRSFVTKLVSLAKNLGLSSNAIYDDWKEIVVNYNLFLEEKSASESRAIAIAQEVLTKSIAKAPEVIDFDDMLYMPLVTACRFDLCNYIFIDEAQDTNSVQATLLSRMLAPNGRLIAVGDPNQSIYGFRGAGANAMDDLRDAFKMQTLPLSVSYRCAKAIVTKAQEYCK